MTVGPLHLIVVSFNDDKVVAEIGKQLELVRKRGIIRLFDFLYILKHENGEIAFKEMSDLSSDEKHQYGGIIKSLIGLVVDDGEALKSGTVAEIPGLAEHDFGINEDELHYVADKIPAGHSAILVLFEHHWAIGLKDAIAEAGGQAILQGLINPEAFKIVGTELEPLLAAAKRLEETAVSDAMQIMAEATAAKEEAEAEALQVKMAAAAAVAVAEERAQKAMAEAKEVEELTAAEAAMLKEAAERDRLEAAEVRAAAEKVKEQAVEEAREVVAASKAVEALAMEEAAEVLEQAHQEEETAIRRAAAVMDAADDAEARAIMRAIEALLAAEIIEQEAMEEAVQAVIAAQIVEDMAAQRAGRALLSGKLR
ncbi:MAG: hypothetical protein IAF02_04015 [Anaerolineae bacterium]|nr:hypothetical protein [Anaerolineae bacterium]